MIANIHYVNNTGSDITGLFPFFKDAYKTGTLHDDVADLFTIKFVDGLNEDETARMVIEAA